MPPAATGGSDPTPGSAGGDPHRRGSIDGRTARKERNRAAALDAVLDLFGEGQLTPSPQQVAARSGVSLRSVYRYFDDEDELIRSAIARNMERVRPYVRLDRPGVGTTESRIRRIVSARLDLYQRARPMMQAAIHRSWSTPILAERLDEVTEMIREQAAEMFEPELSALRPEPRQEVLDAVDVVLSYDGMEHLCGGLGRSVDEAGSVMRRSLRALLVDT